MLGYDVDARGGRLVVNQAEAARVRALFELYLEHRSVIGVAREVNRRGWTTKQWTTREGREHRGRPLGKGDLYKILTNVVYVGQVNHKGTRYPGEHPAIIDAVVFQKVQEQLSHHGLTGGKEVRNQSGGLLGGLLHCEACGTAMLPTYTLKNGRRYRYYVCRRAQQRGWEACPSPSLSAQQIEEAVVERVRRLAGNPPMVAEAVRQAGEQREAGAGELRVKLQAGEGELGRLNAELAKVAATTGNRLRVERLADLQDRIGTIERRLSEVRGELDSLAVEAVSEEEIAQALRSCEPVWKSRNSHEQRRILRTLIERVGYDGRSGKVAVTFRWAGFQVRCGGVE